VGEPAFVARVTVRVEEDALDPSALRELLDSSGCGSIVSFVGLTRGQEDGVAVEHLEFDAWEQQLPSVMQDIAIRAVERFDVSSIVMAHRTGVVKPAEPIVCIHVGSPHRAEGFEACSWLISELKSQAPLWKKEVLASGEVWKSGLG
jgi:molybdopterin synthase catalytic subunit